MTVTFINLLASLPAGICTRSFNRSSTRIFPRSTRACYTVGLLLRLEDWVCGIGPLSSCCIFKNQCGCESTQSGACCAVTAVCQRIMLMWTKERFMLDDLKIPAEWIHEAKALRARLRRKKLGKKLSTSSKRIAGSLRT
ncbi:hypothetical protein OS493_039561 [Desmophyllum pertusum]|uniref:Secreted protein n=1 Tax=Desmophyllum pertusum TaxID=174260 RepID=A0A9W9ZIP9_9CNID|nr:hypothetical protein OS493_039561 [Desmophyllum pertusum]